MIITGDGQPLEITVEHNVIDIEIETAPSGVLLVPVAGRDGTSVKLEGSVPTYADLPGGLTVGDKGALYVVEADGLGYLWSGTAWPADGDGFEIRGPEGPAGPANSLSIGTVTSGAAAATITGTAPSQTLNLTLPKGDRGDEGPTGPANTLTVGTVTGGTSASATITGTAPSQTLNLVLPKGDQGIPGEQGPPGEVSAAQLSSGLATKADLVGGVIPQAQLPAIAVTEFLGAVANQTAMLALAGQRGDWCTRTDTGTDWQLIAEPSSTLASWRERTYPASPVSSVAGRTGAVTLSTADVTDMTTVGKNVAKATDAAAARTAIGAGTSSLVIGTSGTTAKAGDYQPAAANISDSGVTGRALVQASTAAAARTAIGLSSDHMCPLTPGQYFRPLAGTLSTPVQIPSANKAIGARMLVGRTCTITSLACKVTTAGSTGAVLRMGVYRLPSGSDTATLVGDFGTIAATSTGVKVITGTAAVTAGDTIILMVASQGGPTTRPSVTCVNSIDLGSGISDPETAYAANIQGFQFDASGAFPSTATVAAAGGPGVPMLLAMAPS